MATASHSRISLASDHAGAELKLALVDFIKHSFPSVVIEDLGGDKSSQIDYPDIAARLAVSVVESRSAGVLVCGSGIGVAISANKILGARAATVWDATSARLAKQHTDANILCLGARLIGVTVAQDCFSSWFTAEFSGERHKVRVQKITDLESR